MNLPAFPELETRVKTWPEQVHALTIEDPDGYQRAAQLLTGIKALLREIEESCAPVVKAAYAAHKAATEQRKKLETPLLTAEATIKRMMGVYLRAEQHRRQEEHERLLDEQIAREKDRRERMLAVLRAEDANSPVAEALEAAPLPVVLEDPTVPPNPEGISVRTIYRAEVTDLALLVRSVYEGRAPLKVLLPNMAVLNSFARSLGDTMNWPGVRAVEDVSISAKAISE